MKRYLGKTPALLLLFMGAGAQADPVMECSNQSGSQVEIGDCLANVEKNVEATMEVALGFAMARLELLEETAWIDELACDGNTSSPVLGALLNAVFEQPRIRCTRAELVAPPGIDPGQELRIDFL